MPPALATRTRAQAIDRSDSFRRGIVNLVVCLVVGRIARVGIVNLGVVNLSVVDLADGMSGCGGPFAAPRSGGCGQAGDLVPGREAVVHLGAVLRGGQPVAAGPEVG
jgi:hypothetical protein